MLCRTILQLPTISQLMCLDPFSWSLHKRVHICTGLWRPLLQMLSSQKRAHSQGTSRAKLLRLTVWGRLHRKAACLCWESSSHRHLHIMSQPLTKISTISTTLWTICFYIVNQLLKLSAQCRQLMCYVYHIMKSLIVALRSNAPYWIFVQKGVIKWVCCSSARFSAWVAEN